MIQLNSEKDCANIGITGAHRTGKTTLAKALAQELGKPFLETNARTAFKKLGFDPAKNYDFDTRLHIQGEIMNDIANLYQSSTGFVTDRTPVDLLAYTYVQIGQNQLTEGQTTWLKEYTRVCISLTCRHLDYLVYVPIAIEPVQEENKASIDYGFMHHIDALIIGFAEKTIRSFVYTGESLIKIPSYCETVSDRVATIRSSILQYTYD